MFATLRLHWPEYLMEAAELGAFMMSAALFAALLYYPASPLRFPAHHEMLGRVVTGILMGTTAICLVRSPWGQRSGAHMNPSLTLTFLRLGKIAPWDAAFYVGAQFVGGVIGMLLAAALIGPAIGSPEVNYVATRPGLSGSTVAFVAEVAISFVLMLTVLSVSNTRSIARYTPYFVGALIATYITIEAPLSGMSMNPARTFAPALLGQMWSALWIYFTAPPLGMLLAAELYLRVTRWQGAHAVWCAKLYHDNRARCIFRCAYPQA